MKKIVIVGATSRIAHMTARLWADEFNSIEMVFVGRNLDKLNNVRNDLQSRNKSLKCKVISIDFSSTNEIKECVKNTCQDRVPDIVLIAQGSSLPDNETLRSDLVQLDASIRLNYSSVVLFADAFAIQLEKAGAGHLAVIGSVAGDRGRNSNYIYGASKSAIETYLQGLRHHFALNKKSISVSLIKPGPTVSPLTLDLPKNKLAKAEDVAKIIVKGVRKGQKIIYAPAKWRLIMTIIRLLPDFIFNHLKI